MKLSLVFLVVVAVECCYGSRVKKNDTAIDRPNRESRRYLHYGNRQEEFDSHKQRPNRFKGRRRPKPSTSTPAYDYNDYEDNSSKELKTGYENYFKDPYVRNVGKIFNQKDINDYFLKGNGDYSKLVKNVVLKTQASQYFEDNSTPKLREEPNYKTIVSYDKKDSPSPSYNFASKETPDSSYSYGIKDSTISSFSSKTKDTPVSNFNYNDKDTPVTSFSYGNKDISSNFNSNTKTSPSSSYNYGNKDTTFSNFNYDSKETSIPSYSYGNKDALNSNYYFNTKDAPVSSNKYKESSSPTLNYGKDSTVSSYSYGNKDNYASFSTGTSDTMTSNGWSAMIPKYATSTISPFDYNRLYGKGTSQKEVDANPIKSYASDFNFDTKPLADIQPTKYTVPYGKYVLKNTEYVSEFDAKGNPIPSSSETINDYAPDKEYNYDLTKSFYDYNSKKPMKIENFFGQNSKIPSESSYGWDWDNKGYASNYDYFGKAYQAAFLQRNPDYTKYDLPSAYKGYKYSGPVEVPQPIIVPVPQPYPVKVPIAKPVAVPIIKEIKVPIEKVVPYPVVKNVPYPVEKHVPVPVEKKVPVAVPQPYPVKIPIIKNIYHHAEDHDEPSPPPPKRPNRQRGRGKPRGRPHSDRGHPNRHRQNKYQDKHRDQFDEQDEIHEQYEEYYHEDPHHHRGHHHHYDRFHDRRRHS